jgi:plastocyanin
LKRILAIAIAVAATLAVPATASAATTISVLDDRYSPQVAGEELAAGPTFDWKWDGASGTTLDRHDVVSDNGLFSSGDPVTSGSFSVNASAGTFPYHCTVHDLEGMVGTVSVTPVITDITSKSFRVTWGNDGTTTGNKFDVKYRKGSGKFKSWLKKTNKTSRVFGKKKKPIKVKPGQSYDIEVRSTKGKHKSGYSPPLPAQT